MKHPQAVDPPLELGTTTFLMFFTENPRQRWFLCFGLNPIRTALYRNMNASTMSKLTCPQNGSAVLK